MTDVTATASTPGVASSVVRTRSILARVVSSSSCWRDAVEPQARLLDLQRDDAAHEERGDQEEPDGRGHLQRDQIRAPAPARQRGGGRVAGQRGADVLRLRQLQRRHEARDDQREQRRDRDGHEHRRLDPRVHAQLRPLPERHLDRRLHGGDERVREQDPAERAGAGNDAALDELLADELPPRRAHRPPYRHLVPARHAAREHEIRDVGARDEEHEHRQCQD
jgi:hypothetical protein